MQLRKLTRFFKVSALLMLAAMMVATIAPTSRAQEQINLNVLLADFPGGIGNAIASPGGVVLFPRAASNTVSDVIVDDFNGDDFLDILVGSFNSDEVGLFLGRGNGSFARARMGTLTVGGAAEAAGTATVTTGNNSFVYSDAAQFAGGGTAGANSGQITSMATVAPFGFFGASSRVAVAVDYDGTGTAFADQILYLDIDFNGHVEGNVGFVVNGFTGGVPSAFTGNPVSVCVGTLAGGILPDVAYLCSGDVDTGVADGFVGIDLGGDASLGSPEQLIGGGVAGPVVSEFGVSQGSLYDAEGTQNSVNDYDDETTPDNNRRMFVVEPVGGYQLGLAPRAITMCRSSHLQDGANDVVFCAQDFGSVGDGAPGIDGTVESGPDYLPEGNGCVFVLTNASDNGAGAFAGLVNRAARRLSEDYDFGDTPAFPFGKQNSLILVSGNQPSGVSGGDFNADNAFDICASNALSGTVTVFNSGMVPSVQPTAAPASPLVQSYPNTSTSFLPVGGTPNTIYSQDLNSDGKVDILGTNGLPGGYALFGATTNGANLFAVGSLQGIGIDINTPNNPATGARSLAIDVLPPSGIIPINGVKDPIEFQNSGVATPGLQDIVVARLAGGGGGVRVGYGSTSGANFIRFAALRLSSHVGVVEGNLNGDALPDVAICDRGAGQVVTITNAAAGLSNVATRRVALFSIFDFFPVREGGGLSSIDIGNVNPTIDNARDIVVSVDGPNDQAVVLFNLGTVNFDFDFRFSIRAFPIGGDPTALKLADLAGPAGPGSGTSTGKDGAPEIIACNRRSNTVTTLINNGAGIFGQGRVAETGGFDPLSQTLGDFNDDGKLDTAVLNRGRRGGFGTGTGEEDDSIVSVLLGNGDGSFQATNFLIPVNRASVSIASTGYGVVRNAIQVDYPDINLDGLTDLVVASQQGGGIISDIDNPFTANVTGPDDMGALTVLFGSSSQPGQFVRSTEPQALVDTLRTGGRVATFPGSIDVIDGRIIGYGELAINADFNQNGRPDGHVGGVETNNAAIIGGGASNNGLLESNFASSITSLDNLTAAFAAQRTTNVYPSALNDLLQTFGISPVDDDNITGVCAAGNFVVSDTGAIVDQATNDFDGGLNQIVPDVVSVTRIGRVYEAINISSVLNHAPIVTTTNGNRAFDGPGRKVVLSEGEEKTVRITANDVDQSFDNRQLRFRLSSFPNFVSLTDNGNGTATITVKPGLADGSATANNGLGQSYNVAVEVTDQDFRLPLTGQLFFRIFVKDSPTAPVITPIPDQTVNATLSLSVPVDAVSLTNRNITLSTTFAQPFSTFTSAQGQGLFTFRPQEVHGGVYNVSVTATDDLGLSATASFKLTVIVNSAPTIGAIADVTMIENEVRDVTITSQDSDLTTLNQTLNLSVTGAPGFAILTDNGRGNGFIRLSPKSGDAGTFTITVRTTDNGIPSKFAEVRFNVTVNSDVRITAASYAKKRLFVAGFGFGTSPTLIVNGQTVPANLIVPTSAPNSITAKGNNKKQLGLRKGTNTIEVIGLNGRKSPGFTLNLTAQDAE